MTDILLATDSDPLAKEVEAAIAGTHLLHRVRAGVHVVEAIEMIDPSLVLLDLQIGNMGGAAACLAVRHREGIGTLEQRPIMLLLDRTDDAYLAGQAGADHWLVKPLDPFTTLRAIEAALAEEPSTT